HGGLFDHRSICDVFLKPPHFMPEILEGPLDHVLGRFRTFEISKERYLPLAVFGMDRRSYGLDAFRRPEVREFFAKPRYELLIVTMKFDAWMPRIPTAPPEMHEV